MNRRKFSKSAPGRLVPIVNDHAFVPAPLPPDWTLSATLQPLLMQARESLAELRGVTRNLPTPYLLLRPLRRREALRSSTIEGTDSTPRELLLYELDPPEIVRHSSSVDAAREVANYVKALDVCIDSDLPLCLRLIREMHRTLLQGVRGADQTPGDFRRAQVAIGTSRRFIPPPSDHLTGCLDDFEKYLHKPSADIDPIVDCFLVHYQFETIHPFPDGNGRVGRVLLSYMLAERGGFSQPWVYLSPYFEKHREEYVDGLFNVAAKGRWDAWVELCLHATIDQVNDTMTRCDRILELQADFTQIVDGIKQNSRLHTIVKLLFEQQLLRVNQLKDVLDVTYPTARRDVDKLIEAGILDWMEEASQLTVYSPELFDVVFEDLS